MLKKLTFVAALALIFLVSICSLTAQTVLSDYRDGQLYVLVRPGFVAVGKAAPVPLETAVESNSQWQQLASLYGFTATRRASLLDDDPVMSRYLKVEFQLHSQIHELIAKLKQLDFIEDAEPVELLYKTYTPNDLNNNQWALPLIRAREAWALSRGSAGVVVAVIDDAVQTTHLDLAPNVWVNPNEIPNNGRDDDGNGLWTMSTASM